MGIEEIRGDISTITTGSSNREDSILNGEYTFLTGHKIRTSSRFLFDKETNNCSMGRTKFILNIL